jgi:2,4-dienoyl-CoA reductase-like NADH-dependent reductase (Old Yellow Enzyme family)
MFSAFFDDGKGNRNMAVNVLPEPARGLSLGQTFERSSASVAALFTPFVSGNLTLPNRIVMAPMTRSFSPGGIPGPDVAAYYRRRAQQGVGLILTEGTGIAHLAALGDPKVPQFHGAAALEGWAVVKNAVHETGGKIMPQLWHVGLARKIGSGPNPEILPVGPSGLAKPGVQVVEPMTEAEIEAVIAAYVESAGNAKRLGFDGIELHGAHGYLIDQFFWEGTNRRTDRYGGDLVGRTRFAVEVIAACRRAVGADFPIILRFSQWKLQDYEAKLATTPEELGRFLAPLIDAGVDIFHCSTRRFWQPEFPGSTLNLAGWTKKLTGLPTITVGSVGLDGDFITSFTERKASPNQGVEPLVRMVEDREVDLVAVGRALLVDAAWAAKLRDGRTAEMIPFTVEAFKTLS